MPWGNKNKRGYSSTTSKSSKKPKKEYKASGKESRGTVIRYNSNVNLENPSPGYR